MYIRLANGSIFFPKLENLPEHFIDRLRIVRPFLFYLEIIYKLFPFFLLEIHFEIRTI